MTTDDRETGGGPTRMLPVAVFVVVATLVVVIWLLWRGYESQVRQVRMSLSADQIALRLEQYIDSRMDAVAVLRAQWMHGLITGEDAYRARVGEILDHFTEFQALNWIDDQGVIRWVVPLEDNRAVIDADLNEHAMAGPILRQAHERNEARATPPIVLLQSGFGFAAYVPLGSRERRLGYLNAVFRVGPLIEACLTPDEPRSYDCAIYDGDQLVYRSTNSSDGSRATISSREVRVLDRRWRVQVSPRFVPSEAFASAASIAVLATGLLIALGLGWVTARWVRSADALRARTEELQAAVSRHKLVMAELDHRVKNTLTAILSLAALTQAEVESLDEFIDCFSGRVRSLARTHEALSAASWAGVELPELVRLVVHPTAPAPEALSASGGAVRFPAYAAAPLSLALHELATNALEHGAWSVPGGTVDLRWQADSHRGLVRMTWQERGGPPIDGTPTPNTGMMLLRGFTEYELRGTLATDFRREGLICSIEIPMEPTSSPGGTGP